MPSKTAAAIAQLKPTRAVFQTQTQKHKLFCRHKAYSALRVSSDSSEKSERHLTPVPASQTPWQSSKREQSSRSKDDTPEHAPTELIFNLYNRGSGWGEEIIPHLTVQQRAVVKKPRREWQVRLHAIIPCSIASHACTRLRHFVLTVRELQTASRWSMPTLPDLPAWHYHCTETY